MRRDFAGWTLGLAMLVGCGEATTPNSAPPTLSVSPPPAAGKPDAAGSVPTPQASLDAAKSLAQGDLATALAAADRGVTAAPLSAQAYETRAAVHHKLGALDAAFADFSQAIALDPRNARLLNNRGFLQLSRQAFEPALADFDAAIALDPNYANAFNNRGLTQIAQGRYRQAVLDLDKAILADPNYVDAYNNRGFALMQLTRWDRALADFNRALQLDPQGANALANRGFVKQSLGDTTGAILDYTSAMMLDPDNPKYYLHRREAYLRQGDLANAKQDADKVAALQTIQSLGAAVKARPKDADAYLARGKHHHQAGDETRALADFDRAVEFDPISTEVRLARAALHWDRRDFAAAEADCAVVLAETPHQQALSIRGDCRLERGDLDGALADFEAAKRLDDRVALAYLLKARELAKQGDNTGADEYNALAKSLDPEVEARRK